MTKYIITDPCYILPEERWDKCCTVFQDKAMSPSEQCELFNRLIAMHLTNFSGKLAYVCDTGIGDWTNTIAGPIECIESCEFCADAGMVCVCEFTNAIEKALIGKYPHALNGLAALINCEGTATVSFDTSDRQWTVVSIKDTAGHNFHSQYSESFDEDDG